MTKVIKPTTLLNKVVSTTATDNNVIWNPAYQYTENDIVSVIEANLAYGQIRLSQAFAAEITRYIVGLGSSFTDAIEFLQTPYLGRMYGDINNSGTLDLSDATTALNSNAGLNITLDAYTWIYSVLIPEIQARAALDATNGTNYNSLLEVVNSQSSLINGVLYQCLVSGTSSLPPPLDKDNWFKVGPSNPAAMFDREVSTHTTQTTGPLTVVIAAGFVNSLSLFGLSGDSVTVTVTNGSSGPPVYGPVTISLDGTIISDWYQYFFEPSTALSDLTLTDLPPYVDAYITVSIAGTNVACGVLDIGTAYDLGDAEYGAKVTITDYSKKLTDEFGTTTFVKRSNARRITLDCMIDNVQINKVFTVLKSLTATPVTWIGTNATGYEPLNVFGWFEDVGITVSYPTKSLCSLTIQGLSE